MKDIHAYFDISYEGQGNLIQADNNATYMFSKICRYSGHLGPLKLTFSYIILTYL